MREILYILFILLGLILFSSCSEEAIVNPNDEPILIEKVENDYANLVVSMNPPSLSIESRGNIAQFPYDRTKWTTWEKFVDGALLYHVTLFVINEDGTLVAYRDFYNYGNNEKGDIDANNGYYNTETTSVDEDATTGIAVKATFNSAQPKHGNIEKLQPGQYKIIAVANYAPINDNSSLFPDGETPMTYGGLGSVAEDGGYNNGLNGDFNELVKSFIGTNFSQKAGLSSFTNENTNEDSNIYKFFHYVLNSGDDRVCKQLPQPLVMIRNVTLNKGENYISGELSRTFARVRLEVQRTDTSEQFAVENISFIKKDSEESSAYASRNAYLFNDVTAGVIIAAGTKDTEQTYNPAYDAVSIHHHWDLYESTNGELDVDSEDCMISSSGYVFNDDETTQYAMMDCYILEGKTNTSYAFSFNVKYWTSPAGAQGDENKKIGAFESYTGGAEGNEAMTGLADTKIYIHAGAVEVSHSVTDDQLPKYLFYAERESVFSDNGKGKTSEQLDDVGEGSNLDAKYIWQIIPTSESVYYADADANANVNVAPSTNTADPGVGIVKGYLMSIGTGLYLQAYNGSSDIILGEQSELIFIVNFEGNCEVGTIISKFGEQYYCLAANDNVISWVEFSDEYGFLAKYTGTATAMLSRGPGGGDLPGGEGGEDSSFSPDYDFHRLTFSTTGGSAGIMNNKLVTEKILIQNTADGENKIIRNDFYHGIIPISLP